MVNSLMILGVVLNALGALGATTAYPWLGIVLSIPAALTLVGVLLVATGSEETGARIVLWSSFPFIPLGMVGAIGARRCLDALERQRFEAGSSAGLSS